MCTVSWLFEPNGYQLFCNRDEQHTRRAATPPRVQQRRGVSFVAPVDAEAGGTWVGVNEHRLALCLLNGHDALVLQDELPPRVSRGLLLWDLFDCRTVNEMHDQLSARRLENYRSFTLLALAPGKVARVWRWSGGRLSADAAPPAPLVSSSVDAERVLAERRKLFAQLRNANGGVNAARLWDFHRSHTPRSGAHAPCMHRADAQTVSFSHVHVTRDEAAFTYHPQSLCQLAVPVRTTLPWRASAWPQRLAA